MLERALNTSAGLPAWPSASTARRDQSEADRQCRKKQQRTAEVLLREQPAALLHLTNKSLCKNGPPGACLQICCMLGLCRNVPHFNQGWATPEASPWRQRPARSAQTLSIAFLPSPSCILPSATAHTSPEQRLSAEYFLTGKRITACGSRSEYVTQVALR